MLVSNYYRKLNTDSRFIKAGEIFLPLVGEKFDGHDFLLEAFKKGASEAYSQISEDRLLEIFGEEIKIFISRINFVNDTLKTYHELANEFRNLINPLTIGITGSSGKTTTKELLKTVLEPHFKIHYSQANFNNEIGVPKTILSMPEDTEILILEMGMRGLGQIEALSKIAEPNMAVITNIGTAHIEILGSKENIEKAKLEIIHSLRSSPKLPPVFLVDENLYKRLEVNNRLEEYKSRIPNLFVDFFDYKQRFYIQGLLSRGISADINAVSKIANLLGLKDEMIQRSLENYKVPNGRGDFKIDQRGYLWIDSTYNANPDSLRNDLEALLNQFPNHHMLLVISRIEESQENLVKEIWEYLYEISKNPMISLLDLRFMEIENAKLEIQKYLLGKNPQDTLVFLKASRAAGLERLI